MKIPYVELSQDDMFVLGNIASMAIHNGLGARALPILHLMQEVRPKNAAAFLLEAMYLYSIDNCDKAIGFIETSGALQATLNQDEAVAFHLFLLQKNGETKRAANLGQSYLNDGALSSEVALETVRIITTECQHELSVLLLNQPTVSLENGSTLR